MPVPRSEELALEAEVILPDVNGLKARAATAQEPLGPPGEAGDPARVEWGAVVHLHGHDAAAQAGQAQPERESRGAPTGTRSDDHVTGLGIRPAST